MTKIAFVLGTRPEITKLYSCIQYCTNNNVDHYVVNTDQHYDKQMRDVFFEELGLRQPKYSLGIGSGSHSTMLAKMLIAIEGVFMKDRPDVVVVQGDTNTVLAGCLVANKMGIKVAHVEAGLRSYDRTMPEEYNRVVTDHCADYLFAPTEKQREILLKEAIDPKAIFITGNTAVDAVQAIVGKAQLPKIDQRYVLLTCHRPSNTDEPANLEAILSAVQTICEREDMLCLFPAHPRLNDKKAYFDTFDRIRVSEPFQYSEMLGRAKDAEMILTDSGGIQEEACTLQKKCLVLRTNTERPEVLDVGGAVLLDEITKDDILAKYQMLKERQVKWYNPFGDGKAGERIINILTKGKAQ